jgi:predicted aspartyl protease
MVLDLNNHVILAHPGGQMKEISEGIRSILTNEGYTPISLSVVNNHLQVPAVINGTQSRMIVDSGAFFTAIDRDAARKLRIGGYDTGAVARGLGTGGRGIGYAHFPEMKLGDFTIKNVSVTVSALNPEIIQGKQPAAGFLGADYLGPCGAIFDFNSNTLYLRPKKN